MNGIPTIERILERNQSWCGLLNLVQGRRSLHPNDEDLSLGAWSLVVASTRALRFWDTVTLVSL